MRPVASFCSGILKVFGIIIVRLDWVWKNGVAGWGGNVAGVSFGLARVRCAHTKSTEHEPARSARYWIPEPKRKGGLRECQEARTPQLRTIPPITRVRGWPVLLPPGR